ncbi:uncharacterized protein PgNI_01996 [Pyricularia grisea]|uniref:Uncharacterized protein n=1 Tax=Pyricularia grisea TaxID=148305 RepID=A0A6P8BJV8_PYRGI|nr:uncharacterized protein PgNI_01996 [Pyricularia grisea]TLD16867.1 hypothetical protein PgNI_01996 [Pyricularia grisea]
MKNPYIRLGYTPSSMKDEFKTYYRYEKAYIYEVDEDDNSFIKGFIRYLESYPQKKLFYDNFHLATDVAKKIPIRWTSIKRWWVVTPGPEAGTNTYEKHENTDFQPQRIWAQKQATQLYRHCSRMVKKCFGRRNVDAPQL